MSGHFGDIAVRKGLKHFADSKPWQKREELPSGKFYPFRSKLCFWSPPRERPLGLWGGSAIGSFILEVDELRTACFDQENAFTYISVPTWWQRYQCAPTVKHYEIGGAAVTGRDDLAWDAWVHPCYKRLAMGGTHSVDEMIAVNLYAVGQSMFSSRSLHLTAVLNSAHLKLSGVPSEGAGVVWEFFAGSAVWTKALTKRGYAYLTPVEITDCSHLGLLNYLFLEKCILVLRAKLVDAAHFGTPCSSLSIAITPPWRSAEYPFGFPNLVGVAAAKVRVGNALSSVAAQLIVCDECGVAVTDENPATSWHWKLPVIIALYARALAFEALLC
ncbi:unnamed protein product [Polarella glacialis]|uniref:Uncharacterized protein n=1 Tax=Polarella glacialis TaxID=89957 RepID=A0A813H1P3_POLGL|nr:unnamed protein product [Polarella glacialis]